MRGRVLACSHLRPICASPAAPSAAPTSARVAPVTRPSWSTSPTSSGSPRRSSTPGVARLLRRRRRGRGDAARERRRLGALAAAAAGAGRTSARWSTAAEVLGGPSLDADPGRAGRLPAPGRPRGRGGDGAGRGGGRDRDVPLDAGDDAARARSPRRRPAGRRWFQLYCFRDEGVTRALMDEAVESGFEAIVVTVDAPARRQPRARPAHRLRDSRRARRAQRRRGARRRAGGDDRRRPSP